MRAVMFHSVRKRAQTLLWPAVKSEACHLCENYCQVARVISLQDCHYCCCPAQPTHQWEASSTTFHPGLMSRPGLRPVFNLSLPPGFLVPILVPQHLILHTAARANFETNNWDHITLLTQPSEGCALGRHLPTMFTALPHWLPRLTLSRVPTATHLPAHALPAAQASSLFQNLGLHLEGACSSTSPASGNLTPTATSSKTPSLTTQLKWTCTWLWPLSLLYFIFSIICITVWNCLVYVFTPSCWAGSFSSLYT